MNGSEIDIDLKKKKKKKLRMKCRINTMLVINKSIENAYWSKEKK